MNKVLLLAAVLALPISGWNQTTVPPVAAVPDINSLAARVEKLENAKEDKLTPAWIACVAVIFTAVVTGAFALYGQRTNAQRQLSLDRNKSLFEQTEKILEFKIRQLEQFYAPMFARLGQSQALHFTLLRQLAKECPARYRMLDMQDQDGNWLIVTPEGGEPYGFRLIDELPAIRDDKKAIVLVDRILAIGKEMTGIIAEHAGLATESLVGLLGRYAAHFAILSAIRESEDRQAFAPPKKEKGYYPYPRELNGEVEAGYRELSHFLDSYAAASKQMLRTVEKEFENRSV